MDLKTRRAIIKALLSASSLYTLKWLGLDYSDLVKFFEAIGISVSSDVLSIALDTMLPRRIPALKQHLVLADQVMDIENWKDWVPILCPLKRSFVTVNEFNRILMCCEPPDRQRILQALLRLIDTTWGANRDMVDLGAAILTRFSSDIDKSRVLVRLSDRVEEIVGDIDARMVHTLESLSYVFMAKEIEGPFVGNFKRFVMDTIYRSLDNDEGSSYYGSFPSSIDALFRHLRDRPEPMHVHDIGRAISLMPNMADNPKYTKLMPFVQKQMLASLGEFKVSGDIKREARKLLKQHDSPKV